MTDTTAKPRTTRQWFRHYMAQRRTTKPGSLDRQWLTATCSKLFWLYRGVPASEWGK